MQRQLIYGTASLHRLATADQRQQALLAAYDAGFRAYDLAPAYGNGIDETEVGIAFSGRRHEVELNTKYGIPITPYARLWRHAFPVRRLVDRTTGRSASAYRRRDFSPRAMGTSLVESLTRLRTDYVDALFLHEPIAALSAAELEDIIACGKRMKDEGKIRALGVAGPLPSLLACASLDGFDVLQTRCADLSGLPPVLVEKPVTLFGVHAAYRAAHGTDFPEFVRRLLAGRSETKVIVTSRRLETIRAFREITA